MSWNVFAISSLRQKSIQILISQYVYARNFYCFNCFFHSIFPLFMHLPFSLSLINWFSFYTKETYTIFQKRQISLWHGTRRKIKDLNTKLLIRVHLQIILMHFACGGCVLLGWLAGCLGLALAFVWGSAHWEGFSFCFSMVFC